MDKVLKSPLQLVNKSPLEKWIHAPSVIHNLSMASILPYVKKTWMYTPENVGSVLVQVEDAASAFVARTKIAGRIVKSQALNWPKA